MVRTVDRQDGRCAAQGVRLPSDNLKPTRGTGLELRRPSPHQFTSMSDTSSIATAATLVDVDLKELAKSGTLLEEPVLLVTRLRFRGRYARA